MNMSNKKQLLGIILLVFLLWLMPFWSRTGISQTYNETYLLNTTVNVTNSAPMVYDVLIPAEINLIAYNALELQCNVSTYDYNNDTLQVNATFFRSNESTIGAIDKNYRYLNSSCLPATVQDYYMNWTCTFNVSYFANNGTWFCNSTAVDTRGGFASNQSSMGTVNSLIAIKLDPVLDFGQLEVGQTSNDTLANITNAGNRAANISVKGWGSVEGDGFAFDCEFGSINIENEKYSITNGTTYSSMTALTVNSVNLTNYFVPQRVDEEIDSVNSTYWKIYIPNGAGGLCTGKILFTASDKG